MTRQAQKEEEMAVTRFYLNKASIDAEIIDAAEPPDIIIQCGDRRIGIELTSYTQPHREGERSLRQTEAAWQDLLKYVRAVRADYPDLAGLSIWLKFTDGLMPGRKDFPLIVREMANFAGQGKSTFDTRGYARPALKYPTLHRFISLIRMRHVGHYMDWTYSGYAGSIGAKDDEVYPIVRRRNDIVLKQQVDQLWLIVYGGHTISQMLDYFDDDMSEFVGTVAAVEAGPFTRLVLIGPDIRTWEAGAGWSRIAAH